MERTYRDGMARLRVRVPQGLTGVIELMGGRTQSLVPLDT